jgi:hypothetical protein
MALQSTQLIYISVHTIDAVRMFCRGILFDVHFCDRDTPSGRSFNLAELYPLECSEQLGKYGAGFFGVFR